MPSKALLRPGEALAAARWVPAAAGAVTGLVDVDQALVTRDAFAGGWDDTAQADWLTNIDVDIVRGRGRLAGVRAVEVTTPNGTCRAGYGRLGAGSRRWVSTRDAWTLLSPTVRPCPHRWSGGRGPLMG